jgi:hypothetical protein
MFDFFKKGPAPSNAVDAGGSTHFHSTQRESVHTLELAKVVLADTLKRNGIPKGWVQVECLDIVLRPGLKGTQLQLVMQRWSEQLLHYSAALQLQFLAGLDHFEPGVDHSGYTVSWRFSNTCVMPSALIPEGVAWYVSSHGTE